MEKILLANTDLFYREMLGEELQKEGYEVTTVSSGSVAYFQLKSKYYDIGILDTHLSEGKSGLEVLALINKDADLFGEERIPLIITTSSHSSEIEKEAYKSKASAFLVKPFKIKDLIRVINKVKKRGN